jgi:hypothetical protein
VTARLWIVDPQVVIKALSLCDTKCDTKRDTVKTLENKGAL